MTFTYTLYAPEASFRAFATLIAAEYNGIEVQVSTDDVTAATEKSPVGKLPILELSHTNGNKNNVVIFSSHAMARYVASLRRDTGLTGQSIPETAQIDAWMDWTAHEVELPACVWFYPVVGYMPFSKPAYEKAKADLAKALEHLNTHLEKKQYLVGNQMTLADIVAVSTLLYPFKLVADKAYLKPYANVLAWFQHCVAQPEFQQVIGVVTMCKKELMAKGQE